MLILYGFTYIMFLKFKCENICFWLGIKIHWEHSHVGFCIGSVKLTSYFVGMIAPFHCLHAQNTEYIN